MSSIPYRVGIIGVVLILLGGAMIAGGTYRQATSDCKSVEGLHVTTSSPGGSNGAVTSFDDLSPVEQRIFLEAYTDDDNSSRSYENWSASWFDGVQAVSYRNETYRVSVFTTACAEENRLNFKLVGIAIVLVGTAVLGTPPIRDRLNR